MKADCSAPKYTRRALGRARMTSGRWSKPYELKA
jgi:hypothetical protein